MDFGSAAMGMRRGRGIMEAMERQCKYRTIQELDGIETLDAVYDEPGRLDNAELDVYFRQA